MRYEVGHARRRRPAPDRRLGERLALGHKPTVCVGCFVMPAGYIGLATWHSVLWPVIAANSVAGLGIGLVSSAMAVVLTERSGRASTGISVGTWITVRAVGGSMAGAGFAALLTRVTIAGTGILREWAYVAVWLTCGWRRYCRC